MRDAKSHQPISIANSSPNYSGLLREWIFCRPVTPPPRGVEVLAVSQISVATTLHPSLNLFVPSSPVGFSARLLLLLRWPSPRTRMSLPRLFPTESGIPDRRRRSAGPRSACSSSLVSCGRTPKSAIIPSRAGSSCNHRGPAAPRWAGLRRLLPPSPCCTEGSRPRPGLLVSTASAVLSHTVAGPLRQAGPGSADYPRPRPAVLKALVLALGPRSGRDPPALRAPRARAGDSTTKLAGRAPEAPVPTRTTRRCLGPTWSLLDASRDPNAT